MKVEVIGLELLVVLLAALVLVADLFLTPNRRHAGAIPCLTATGLLAIFLFSIWKYGYFYTMTAGSTLQFQGESQGFFQDSFSLFFKQIFLLIGFALTLLSVDYFRKHEARGEYHFLFLMVITGMMFMVSSEDLLMIFLSLELTSLPLYILAAYLKRDPSSSEAGMKYFLLGALSSALLLYGMSLIYGVIGTTHLSNISGQVTSGVGVKPALLTGLLFFASGFAFKIAAVPFHMWAPDVYEGAPTPVTAFLSVGPKAAAIAVMLRVLLGFFPGFGNYWTIFFSVLAALSMTVGNLLALHQDNLKRMLAYSGISHMGYILVGLAACEPVLESIPFHQLGFQAALFYIALYVVTNLTAFGVLIYLGASGRGEGISSVRGLGRSHPWLALVMLIALLSLAGVPPLAGFIGKVYLFLAAFRAGLYWLVVLALINSVISLFYYFKVARAMYFEKGEEVPLLHSPLLHGTLLAGMALVILIGLYPSLLAGVSKAALLNFLH